LTAGGLTGPWTIYVCSTDGRLWQDHHAECVDLGHNPMKIQVVLPSQQPSEEPKADDELTWADMDIARREGYEEGLAHREQPSEGEVEDSDE